MKDKQTIWSATKSLLVFYVFDGHEEFNDFRKALDVALADSSVTRLKVIILIADPKENVLKHSLFTYISEKSITLFGNKVKKKAQSEGEENLEMVISTHYDLFLSFGTPSPKVMKWLTKVNATRKIAINADDHPLFDVNLASSFESIEKSVNFTIDMLNKIN